MFFKVVQQYTIPLVCFACFISVLLAFLCYAPTAMQRYFLIALDVPKMLGCLFCSYNYMVHKDLLIKSVVILSVFIYLFFAMLISVDMFFTLTDIITRTHFVLCIAFNIGLILLCVRDTYLLDFLNAKAIVKKRIRG